MILKNLGTILFINRWYSFIHRKFVKSRIWPNGQMGPNIGLNIQFPYFPIGPVDISPGLSLVTYSLKQIIWGLLKAFTNWAFVNIDLRPILYFFPENLHLTLDGGLNFNLATDLDQDLFTYDIDLPLGYTDLKNENMLDQECIWVFGYYLSEIPIALNYFSMLM